MRNNRLIILLACAVFSIAPLSLAVPAADQAHGAERVFHHNKKEVDKAVQDLHATFTGRLPILDGFADQADEQWDRYGRGYFECAVQVIANGQDETRVRVTAKITAWYTDPNPVQSGYRVLPSNGRVEMDLLDRIEEALGSNGPVSGVPQSQSLGARPETSARSSMILPTTRIRPETDNLAIIDKSALVRGEPSGASPKFTGSPAAGIVAAPSSSGDIESLRRRREQTERQLSELTSVVQNLEDILRNQTHPTDIAVVRKSGTHVMSKPSANGSVLFSADSEDEFQVLDSGPDWIHVQISGVSRGWIRRSDLNLPEGLVKNSTRSDATAPANEPPFRVIREETNAFKGTWEPLSGKTVKIIWAGPAAGQVKPATARAKRNFAKSLLVTAYQQISSHDPAVAGVVIVFDSADGGQIATTLENLKQWQAGSLSETSFWRLCSVDPPELFDR
jgi:hypothetical protein